MVIARHALPTLVIVDRKPLVEQWRDRLVTHLGLSPRQIGQLGGGRNRATGIVDNWRTAPIPFPSNGLPVLTGGDRVGALGGSGRVGVER